jgi:GDP-4-dehydro-6-deoxy-D-mannose reductase
VRGEVYNVCRGEAVKINELLDLMRDAVSVPVEVTVDPAKLRPVDVPVLLGDHGRLTAATGWQPEIPIAQTLNDILVEQRDAVRA